MVSCTYQIVYFFLFVFVSQFPQTNVTFIQVSAFLRKQLKLKNNDPLVRTYIYISTCIAKSHSNTSFSFDFAVYIYQQFVLSESGSTCGDSFWGMYPINTTTLHTFLSQPNTNTYIHTHTYIYIFATVLSSQQRAHSQL